MFCRSLRRRPSFAPTIPTLQDRKGLNLLESQLDTHDLSLPLLPRDPQDPFTKHDSPRLRILLISPSCLKDLPATTERIQHFSLVEGEIASLAIIFLLSPPKDTTFASAKTQLNPGNAAQASSFNNEAGVHAYSSLRVQLMNDCPGALSIPFLLLIDIDGLTSLLNKHVAQIKSKCLRATTAAVNTAAPPLKLLSLCTAGAQPLPPDTTYMISDLFPNIREFAKAFCGVRRPPDPSAESEDVNVHGDMSSGDSVQMCRDPVTGRLAALRDLVGEIHFREIMDFWHDEYMVD